HVVRRVDGRVPVVASGTFGGSIQAQADFTHQMADSGVQAVVVITSQLAAADESEAVFMARIEAFLGLTGKVDLGLYECPAPYKRILSAATYGALGQTGRFVFHKDTTSDAEAMRQKLIAGQGTRLNLYNANTPTALPTLRYGAAGVSCIAANVYPELLVWLCHNWESQPQKAERLQRQLTLLDLAVSAKYATSAKRILQMRGLSIGLKSRGGTAMLTSEDAVQHENVLAVVAELTSLLTQA
ncbi:MAG TPA: dihydrodipicolinate synthase family protein, partial [Anaerolineae bacterium]